MHHNKVLSEHRTLSVGLQYVLVISLMMFLSGCSNNTSASGDEKVLLIRTVDENKQPVESEISRWWFTASPATKNDLSCDQTICSEWTLRKTITEPVTVYAHATKVKADDEECWDFFEGEIEVQPQQKEISLTMLYQSTVCK